MSANRAVMMFAGAMAPVSLAPVSLVLVSLVPVSLVPVSLVLGFYVSPWWYLLNAFVGFNLMQSSVTGFCPAAPAFGKPGCRSDTCAK